MIINQFNTQQKTLIIAEIGNNHEGDFSVAQEMVQKAAASGVDAVKFQTFDTDHYVRRQDVDRYNRLKQFELTHDEFSQLAELARSLGVLFISTPFDVGSAAFLDGIVDAYKIASGDLTFYPLVQRVAQSGKPIILSTGASDLPMIERTIELIKQERNANSLLDHVAVLHCVSSYPAPVEEVNLRAITAIQKTFELTTGLSDHTEGPDACFVSVALGAQIIEKHFTLDKHYSDFRDHQLSADPPEMKMIVEKIRLAETLLGNEEKTLQACEENVAPAIRRSIAAGRGLKQGETLTENDFTWIRPATGVAPGSESQFIGKTAKRDIAFGEILSLDDVNES